MTGGVLSKQTFALSSYISYYHLGLGMRESDRTDIMMFLALLVAFCMWSWLAGFALGSLSGGSVWLTGPLLYLSVNNSYLLVTGSIRWGSPHAPTLAQFILDMLIPRVETTLMVFAVPALWGLLQGHRRRGFELRVAVMVVSVIAAFSMLIIWMGSNYSYAPGTWPGPPVPIRVAKLPEPAIRFREGFLRNVLRILRVPEYRERDAIRQCACLHNSSLEFLLEVFLHVEENTGDRFHVLVHRSNRYS